VDEEGSLVSKYNEHASNDERSVGSVLSSTEPSAILAREAPGSWFIRESSTSPNIITLVYKKDDSKTLKFKIKKTGLGAYYLSNKLESSFSSLDDLLSYYQTDTISNRGNYKLDSGKRLFLAK
jgi:hypothetical protein